MTHKERPILFSGPMVRAILEGRKTQTRRIVKGVEFIGGRGDENDPSAWGYPYPDREGYADLTDGIPCPYGKPGDRLWVRETWQDWCPIWQGAWCGCGSKEMAQNTHRPAYAATPDERCHPAKWRPSIHMPRWASRITLEVVSVRVERLQEISNDDAIDEGTNGVDFFHDLWQSINGPGSWDANPWVWVVEFKRI